MRPLHHNQRMLAAPCGTGPWKHPVSMQVLQFCGHQQRTTVEPPTNTLGCFWFGVPSMSGEVWNVSSGKDVIMVKTISYLNFVCVCVGGGQDPVLSTSLKQGELACEACSCLLQTNTVFISCLLAGSSSHPLLAKCIDPLLPIITNIINNCLYLAYCHHHSSMQSWDHSLKTGL